MEKYAELLSMQGIYQDIYNANRKAYKTAKQREEKRRVREKRKITYELSYQERSHSQLLDLKKKQSNSYHTTP